MKRSILFVTYGGGHAKIILPLVKELVERGGYEITLLALTTAGRFFEENGVPTIGFNNILKLYEEPERLKVIQYGSKLAEDNGIVDLEESIAYLGLSYYELVEKYGLVEAVKMYEEKGRAAFLPTNSICKLLEKIKPDLLVTTVSPRAEQASILAAKIFDIPSICINDFINANSAKRIAETKPDITCVVSSGVAEQILQYNRGLRIEVTGNPAFDRLTSLRHDRERVFKRIGVKGDKKVVLWAAQREHRVHPFTGKIGSPELPRKIEEELIKIAQKGSFDVILRAHPNDFVDYSKFSKIINGNQFSLEDLLIASDIIFTISSTVGYEGVLLGRRLLTFEGSTLNDDGPYYSVGLSKAVSEISDIEAKLSSLAKDDSEKIEIDAMLGGATERICQLIEDTLFIG